MAGRCDTVPMTDTISRKGVLPGSYNDNTNPIHHSVLPPQQIKLNCDISVRCGHVKLYIS